MFDILTIAAIVAGIALIVLIAARIGLGSTGWLNSILVMPPMPARPRGTQEDDLPPLVFPDTPQQVVRSRDLEARAA